MDKAIKKAIEGGWQGVCSNCQENWKGHKQTRIGNKYCQATPDKNKLLLDPLFWQALAKTEGWDGKCADCYRNPDGDSYVHKMCKSGSHLDMHGKYFRNKPWVDAMHRFIDHLAEGKDANSFFQDLLNSNKE